jgi:hypothetical protein
MSGTPIVTFGEIDRAVRGAESTMPTQDVVEGVAENGLQSAAMQAGFAAGLEHLKAAERVPGVLTAPDHAVASLLQSFLAEKAAEGSQLAPLPVDGKEAKFDEKDWLGWAGSFFSWWRGIKDYPWSASPDDHAIPNKARIAVLGDWGTGRYGAPVTSKTIESDAAGYQVVLHLGDVYYSGTENEVKDRFLSLWPKAPGAVHRACNSNHEMYAGGYGYFKHTLPKFAQSASYFALHNDHFIIAGLDTAYKEKDLHGAQVVWLEALAAAAAGRRIILLSHHQPYSLFEAGHAKVTAKLQKLLDTKAIFAWYWGHEHRCVLFDAHPAWGLHGRCVGHSGFPYFRDELAQYPKTDAAADAVWRALPGGTTPAGLVLDGPNVYLKEHAARYGMQGHMTLELDGAHLHEVVHAPDGTVLYSKPLV